MVLMSFSLTATNNEHSLYPLLAMCISSEVPVHIFYPSEKKSWLIVLFKKFIIELDKDIIHYSHGEVGL